MYTVPTNSHVNRKTADQPSKLLKIGTIGRYWDCSHSIFKYIKHDFKKKKHMFNVFDAELWPGALPGTPGA